VKNPSIFVVSLAQMAMSASLALANPKQYDSRQCGHRAPPTSGLFDRAAFASDCNGLAYRSTKRTRPSTDPPAAGWTMRMFIRDCLEDAYGTAQFDDLVAQRFPGHMRSELLPGEDCGDDPQD
jgi:hypothetical protein